MPVKFINDPEEWEKLTGSRGSLYIHIGMPRRVEAEQQWTEPYQGFRWPIDPKYPQAAPSIEPVPEG